MKLSVRAMITFVIMAILMGLNNVYSILLTGWGDTGSIVAVILCLIFLGKSGTMTTYNLGQTMASAGGAVGFATAMFAACYLVEPGWSPSLWKLSLAMAAFSFLGVTLAIPLRRIVVKWFFPSAVACAILLKGVTSSSVVERAKARSIMGISGIIAALLTFPTKVAFTVGDKALWSRISLPHGLGIGLDPLLYGVGVVVGARIGLSMLLGSFLVSFIFVPQLTDAGLQTQIGDYVRWTVIGFMTLPSLASIVFALRFKPQHKLPAIFAPRAEQVADKFTTKEWGLLAIGTVVAMVVAVWMVSDLFGVDLIPIVIIMVVGVVGCVILGKVASETDMNPIRLGAMIVLFVVSLVASYGPVSLLGIGIMGAAMASVAVDLFYDLRTGYLIGANPKHQVWMQVFGVLVASTVTVLFLHTLVTKFGLGEGEYFPAPGAVVWASMAQAFAEKGSNISGGVWWAFAIASAVGVLLSFMEAHPRTRRFTPSVFAVGVGMLLGTDMAAAIFLGGVIRFTVLFVAKRRGLQAEEAARSAAFQAGSAIFAAAALTGIVAVILIAMGWAYLPGK